MRTLPSLLVRRAAPLAASRARPIYAVGLQGLIQSTRDFTAAGVQATQSVALPLFAALLLYVGTVAWREGNTLAEKAQRAKLTQRDFGLLFLCLLLDLLGGSSFVLGDQSDYLWAPVSAFLIFSLFDSFSLAAVQFVKEALPWTDVVPVATLSWLIAYAYPESSAARAFGLRRPTLADGGQDADDDFLPPRAGFD